MTKTSAQLDFEYLQILRKIKPYVTCIINTHYIGLIKMWLEKLSNEHLNDKHLRNSYLLRLGKQIEEGILEVPFTEAPPAGHLNTLTVADDDNESFYAAKEVQSNDCVSPLSHDNGQGDNPNTSCWGSHQNVETVPPLHLHNDNEAMMDADEKRREEEENNTSSWVDVSDYSSARVSDCKDDNRVGRLVKVIEQLRYENNELLRIVNNNDCNVANGINHEMSEKVVALQKQLASAMVKNSELQTSIHTLQTEFERCQNEPNLDNEVILTEKHKKEMAALMSKCQQDLDEREEVLMQEMQHKYVEFVKKYSCLKEYYQSKYSEQEIVIENKCMETYEGKVKEMRVELEKRYERKHREFEETKMKEIEYSYEQKLLNVKLQEEQEKIVYQQKLQELRLEFQKEVDLKKIEVQRLEELLQEQCLRMQEEVKIIRKELDTTNNEGSAAMTTKIEFLKRCITKMDKIYRRAEREFNKQLTKMQQEYESREKKNQILMSAQRVEFISTTSANRQKEFDEMIYKLEEKYKQALIKQQNEANKDKRERMKQMNEMQMAFVGLRRRGV